MYNPHASPTRMKGKHYVILAKLCWLTVLLVVLVVLFFWKPSKSGGNELYEREKIAIQSVEEHENFHNRVFHQRTQNRHAPLHQPKRPAFQPQALQVAPGPVAGVKSVNPFVLDLAVEKYPTIADATGQTSGETGEGVRWELKRSVAPRIFLLHGLLDNDDCQNIIGIAQKHIERSQVVVKNPAEKVNNIRTSFGMFMSGSEEAHPSNQKLRRNVAAMAGVPLENIESTQVLRYRHGEYYRAHWDYFLPGFPEELKRGGQRFVTVLTWLNDVPSGGETAFPEISYTLSAKTGGSVMFYSLDMDGATDKFSMHAGQPPKEGYTKWVAVCWVRQHKFT